MRKIDNLNLFDLIKLCLLFYIIRMTPIEVMIIKQRIGLVIIDSSKKKLNKKIRFQAIYKALNFVFLSGFNC